VEPLSAARGFVRLGQAVLITTAVLWLLEWVSSGTVDAREALGIALWVAAVLAALTAAARRLDVERTPVWRQLVALALTAGATSSAVNVFFFAVATAFPGALPAEPGQSAAATAVVGFFDGDALFGFWALMVELPRRIGAQRQLAEERRGLRQEAELARIRSALEPHFVLNTLNTIAGLVTEEPHEARALIATLGDLLRAAMQGSARAHHAVRDEVRWLQGFAQILTSRHAGRLDFAWDVDPSLEHCLLPVLLLQPLLENAVHHGALRRAAPGNVAVRIADGGPDRVRCVVQDDGPGFAPAPRPGARGLELVRRRLAVESAVATLRIESRPGHTRVELTLPRRTA
jgi:signal transduction histidine kinase